jgi:hypothetical protein
LSFPRSLSRAHLSCLPCEALPFRAKWGAQSRESRNLLDNCHSRAGGNLWRVRLAGRGSLRGRRPWQSRIPFWILCFGHLDLSAYGGFRVSYFVPSFNEHRVLSAVSGIHSPIHQFTNSPIHQLTISLCVLVAKTAQNICLASRKFGNKICFT